VTLNLCPLDNHFHVSLQPAESDLSENLVIKIARPEDALAAVISKLPSNWVGGIEISDDETVGPDSMPLIDYWHEPIRLP
jgi:hypothetical protein